jgi:L-lactate dehydrogenase complex protein LldG
MSTEPTAAYDRFARTAQEYDVDLVRVPASAATDAIADAIEAPAVGAPLSCDGVTLPDTVRTDPTPTALDDARTGVTRAAFAVADYGTVYLPLTPDGSEPVSLFPDRHIFVLREADIVPDMAAAFDRLGPRMRDDGGSGILATGPSATADMGALVTGAHGPKAVHGVVVA